MKPQGKPAAPKAWTTPQGRSLSSLERQIETLRARKPVADAELTRLIAIWHEHYNLDGSRK